MGNPLLEILNVRVVGDGDKFIVFSHGIGTDQSAWNRILPYFTRDYRVVLYDLVCAGSVNPDHFDFRRYTSLDPYVDDILSILDSLSVKKCFFVGHSVSAMIGILAAIRRPNLFRKLVLLGASPRQVLERRRLPWRVRDWRDREGIRCYGGKLRGMGARIRTLGGGRGCSSGSERIQQNSFQHETGHHALRFQNSVQQRSPWCSWTGQGSLLHHPNRKGRFCSGICCFISKIPYWG
ncbi:hypothetical protein ZOSMA_234G00120 [Zostera marina]|uniref:AB hydrolase-1 domain-containing protein n=1 Tax=Zostera marina TaxID=29655 RepID=A0A0K9PHX6_ZOSMR|nr:hypothetical protein ZOSMA_234G00120 [Zostera marina]